MKRPSHSPELSTRRHTAGNVLRWARGYKTQVAAGTMALTMAGAVAFNQLSGPTPEEMAREAFQGRATDVGAQVVEFVREHPGFARVTRTEDTIDMGLFGGANGGDVASVHVTFGQTSADVIDSANVSNVQVGAGDVHYNLWRDEKNEWQSAVKVTGHGPADVNMLTIPPSQEQAGSRDPKLASATVVGGLLDGGEGVPGMNELVGQIIKTAQPTQPHVG